MKASRFCTPFRTEVDYWEKALNQITEVTEMLLKVQTQWLYLENIFLGEDIRMQVCAWFGCRCLLRPDAGAVLCRS